METGESGLPQLSESTHIDSTVIDRKQYFGFKEGERLDLNLGRDGFTVALKAKGRFVKSLPDIGLVFIADVNNNWYFIDRASGEVLC